METTSEVRRLLRQIDEVYKAGYTGLDGLSSGTARHIFINAKMERIGEYQKKLVSLVGNDEALRLIIQANDGEGKAAQCGSRSARNDTRH